MPPSVLFDISNINLDNVLHGDDEIERVNPQRGHMRHLDAITFVDKPAKNMAGFKDVRPEEFWVDGHIPGRPLLPGVLMIEAAAQMSSFYTRVILGVEGFIGFGAVENFKFRTPVTPGQRLHLLLHEVYLRHGRICSDVQGLVGGQICFDGRMVGTVM
ncbi:MAG: 3-hydroxyacyl-ACP dehydratase FabZ family protein [Phycisphaerae bacterium]